MRCSVQLTLSSKSLETKDYADLSPGLRSIHYTTAWARGKDLVVGYPHPHRLWEYASAITALVEAFGRDLTGRRILDVGCGAGPLGPALALRHGANVSDIDISPNVPPLRDPVAALLGTRGLPYTYELLDLAEVEGEFDGVLSISVMEHIPADDQERAWRKLASLVAPGGVLVVTIDYGTPGQDWRNDKDREVKPDGDFVQQVAGWLEDAGIHLSPLDPTFHGPEVYDYTFFRFVGRRGDGVPA